MSLKIVEATCSGCMQKTTLTAVVYLTWLALFARSKVNSGFPSGTFDGGQPSDVAMHAGCPAAARVNFLSETFSTVHLHALLWSLTAACTRSRH